MQAFIDDRDAFAPAAPGRIIARIAHPRSDSAASSFNDAVVQHGVDCSSRGEDAPEEVVQCGDHGRRDVVAAVERKPGDVQSRSVQLRSEPVGDLERQDGVGAPVTDEDR